MPDPIAEKVIETLGSVKRMPPEKISLESSLSDLGIDSLDTFTLLFEIEKQFQISIPDEEAKSIRSVKDIVEGVRKLIEAGAASNSVSSASPATD